MLTKRAVETCTLEQKIAAALAAADITSADLAALIAETEKAILAADEAAVAERERAHDPALSPDPASAYQAMQTAAFAAERLKTLLPRIQARYQEAQAQELLAQWRIDYERLKVERDKLAEELREIYPVFEKQITDLLTRISVNDEELSRLHQARPAGVTQHLLGAELVARNLERFTNRTPSIAKTLQLPIFEPDQRLAWPPPQASVAELYAASMVPQRDPHFSADWAAAQKADNVRRAATEARWAEEEAARQAESRRSYEASLRR